MVLEFGKGFLLELKKAKYINTPFTQIQESILKRQIRLLPMPRLLQKLLPLSGQRITSGRIKLGLTIGRSSLENHDHIRCMKFTWGRGKEKLKKEIAH